MQPSDVFLMYWAVGATALAVYFYYKLIKRNTAINVMMHAFHDIAEGKAKLTLRGNKLSIHSLGDDDGKPSNQD